MEPYNLEKKLMEITRGLNSIRPFRERVSYLLRRKEPHITPEVITDVIRKNQSFLRDGGVFCHAGAFFMIEGPNYIIRGFTLKELLSFGEEGLKDVNTIISAFPKSKTQYEIPVEQMDQYLTYSSKYPTESDRFFNHFYFFKSI